VINVKNINIQLNEKIIISIIIGLFLLYPLISSLNNTANYSETYMPYPQMNLTTVENIDGIQTTTKSVGIIVKTPLQYFGTHFVFGIASYAVQTITGYGWWMPLVILIAMDMNLGGAGESLNISSPVELVGLLPFLLPVVSTIIIVKFSSNISPLKTILYVHLIASGMGVIAINSIWPNLLS